MISANFSGAKFKVSMTSIATLSLMFSNGDAHAQVQITSDGTTNTQIETVENTFLLKGGTQAGQNLFHSFEQFSLTKGAIANFDNGADIVNIFSRVTGGEKSEIEGLIKTQSTANLFLLNPAGVIFGANAQLDIGGSLVVSTGDRFIFADGVEFGATDPEINSGEKPLLTITAPVGLKYGDEAGEIAVLPNAERVPGEASGMAIKPGNTLALLGGDVSITRNSLNGSLSNIEMGSVRSGSIKLSPGQNGWQFDYDSALSLGTVELTDRALVVNNSGLVNLQGQTINLTSGSSIINATLIEGTKSTIYLQGTESITLDDSSLISQMLQQNPNGAEQSGGEGGDIFLTAGNIAIGNGSLISAATLGEFPGGNITLNAQDTIALSSATAAANPSIITTSTQGQGDGGDIFASAARLNIFDGSQIQAFGGQGNGGTIEVNATKSIDIAGDGILRPQVPASGEMTEIPLASGFAASSGIAGLPTEQQPQGESGNLIINTPKLNMEESGKISVSNFGLANAGDIEIVTANLNLDQAEIVANTILGNGGSINIQADKSVILDNQSAISTAAQSTGGGGKIDVATGNLVLLESDRISADAQQGSGGKVSVNAESFFAAANSRVSADSEDQRKKGVVEIVTLDLNSRLQTKFKEQSPLVAENYINTGCGAGSDFAANQFRNIGRGGIPNNLMQDSSSPPDVLVDLGNDLNGDSVVVNEQTAQRISAITKTKQFDKSLPYQEIYQPKSQHQSLTEAKSWIVNAQGNIELISPQTNTLTLDLAQCQSKT